MNRCYSQINWENYPSTETPLNELNLNKMDVAIATIDGRVVDFDTTKANQSDLNTALSNWSINNNTGVVTLTKKNGTKSTINTNIGKIATNFSYDAETERLILTLPDGSKTYIDLSALITQYEFKNSDEISFSVASDGKVSASVINGSITENKLQPNFLADCRSAKSGAESSKLIAEGYAQGTQNGQPVTSGEYYHNNAKYWSEQAHAFTPQGYDALVEKVDVHTEEFDNLNADGYIGYNLIPFPYADASNKIDRGVTYTVNDDGSVTAIGTASSSVISQFFLARDLFIDPNKTYALFGDLDTETSLVDTSILFNDTTSSGQPYWNYGKDKPRIFTGISHICNLRIRISAGKTVNQTFYPMLVEVRADGTYPTTFHKRLLSNEAIESNKLNIDKAIEKGYLSYNLIPETYYDGMGTKNNNGITYTVNSDGSITANGTATANSSFIIIGRTSTINYRLNNEKTYALLGCPNGGSTTTYNISVNYTNSSGSSVGLTRDYGIGSIFTYIESTHNYLGVSINIANGQTVSNLTFRPMLVEVNEDGSYPTTFHKRIPSNEELDKKIDSKKVNLSDAYGSDEYNSATSYSKDDYCVYGNKLWKCLVACSDQTPSEGDYWTRVTLSSIKASGGGIGGEVIEMTGTISKDGVLTPMPTMPREGGYLDGSSYIQITSGSKVPMNHYNGESQKSRCLCTTTALLIETVGMNGTYHAFIRYDN